MNCTVFRKTRRILHRSIRKPPNITTPVMYAPCQNHGIFIKPGKRSQMITVSIRGWTIEPWHCFGGACDFCWGLPGAIECQSSIASCDQRKIALLVNSVPLSETIMARRLRSGMTASSSRATPKPESEVLVIAKSFALRRKLTQARSESRIISAALHIAQSRFLPLQALHTPAVGSPHSPEEDEPPPPGSQRALPSF